MPPPGGPGSRERNPVGFPPGGFDPWRKTIELYYLADLGQLYRVTC